MMNVSIYAGTGEGEVGQMNRLEVNGELILTTAQLAKFYDCTVNNIVQTFSRHKGDFIEGEYYFKLDGEDLRDFKRKMTDCHSVTNCHSAIVKLAVNYFSGKKISGEKISKGELTAEKKIKFLLQAAKITKDAVRRENLIATAEKIIIG